ncbi:carcinoembryonic antigen-related cell adhesion molecule 5-like [Argopecten irradians]|uniref:carcinoembryonic antigen-related cell adhesion molecule 5-like n=1 Tax=Argopecten irradians TaxID=31199 RepID=UPI00371CCF67
MPLKYAVNVSATTLNQANVFDKMYKNVCAVTLTGSSEYAFPGTEFTLTCDVPEEATVVEFYRRPDVTSSVGGIQAVGGQCYNTITGVPCTADVCSCVTSGGSLGTVFRWIIQPQTGDQGSVWFCRRTNLNLPDLSLNSDDYTLNVADGPGTSLALSPPDTTYTRTEGDTLPDITCTADCRPGCTFVWTRPDNTNFTVSSVLSLGQLDRSEHGTYRCTARNDVRESTITNSVIVQYGPYSVSLTPPTVTYTPTEGQTIPTITCSADCNPACTYSWTKDGQSYTTGSGLQLTNIQRGQTGVYRCTVSNVYGSNASVNINIIVNWTTVTDQNTGTYRCTAYECCRAGWTTKKFYQCVNVQCSGNDNDGNGGYSINII